MSLRRRALLGAPLAAPLFAAPVTGQRADLRTRLGTLRIGANLERWYTIARDNHPRRLGLAWWQEFRAAGFDHVRIFLPEVKQTGESPEILEMFLQAVRDAAGARLPVLLGLADTFYHSNPWGEHDWAALAARAAYFGSRTDPTEVVLAPLNEPAFPDTATWLPVRDRLLAEVRRAAPRHILMWGGREWCSYRSLLEATPPADPNTVAEVHDYLGGDAAAVEDRFAPVAAWRDRHRLPVLVTELGGAQGHDRDLGAWSADLGRSLPVLRRLHLPVALWSYSHGGAWRIQRDDGATPRPELRALLG